MAARNKKERKNEPYNDHFFTLEIKNA